MYAYDGDGETWRAWVADAMRSVATNGGKNRSVTEEEPASSVELSCQATAAGNVARSMGALEASFAFPTPAEPGNRGRKRPCATRSCANCRARGRILLPLEQPVEELILIMEISFENNKYSGARAATSLMGQTVTCWVYSAPRDRRARRVQGR